MPTHRCFRKFHWDLDAQSWSTKTKKADRDGESESGGGQETDLEDAHPVLLMGLDEWGECVVTFQRGVREEAFPYILEDDVGKVRCLHRAGVRGAFGK